VEAGSCPLGAVPRADRAEREPEYNGYHRGETSRSVSALWYLDAGRGICPYVLGGLNASAAQVQSRGQSSGRLWQSQEQLWRGLFRRGVSLYW
jgi:hypothetical protein